MCGYISRCYIQIILQLQKKKKSHRYDVYPLTPIMPNLQNRFNGPGLVS